MPNKLWRSSVDVGVETMQLYLDTANLGELREAASWGILSGVTTNPSLMAKEKGADFQRTIQEIATLIDGPISAETCLLYTSDAADE